MTAEERTDLNRKIDAEIAKLINESTKLNAETAEIQQNMKYRFWVLAAAYIGALGVLFRFF